MSDVVTAFHRKYRAKTFAEYIGNAKMKSSLMAALRTDVRPQLMLYQGHAGCGKTTMARLTAKEYLCENRDPLGGACGQCSSCLSMDDYIESGDTGSLINVQEIDATETSGKQGISELLEDAQIPAYDGGWKVYIIDECHAISNAAQNRLLKTLEEPAERVLMILCTTDPEKLLDTIISRCQYNFKVNKPTRDELGGLLKRVCDREGLKYELRALSLLCVKGDFVPRNTLVALEQVAREKGEVSYANTLEVHNIVAEQYFFDFYEILLAPSIDVYKYLTLISKVKATTDLKQFVTALLAFTKRGIYISSAVSVEALDKSEIDQYKKLFESFGVGDLAYLLNLLLNMRGSFDIESHLLLLGYTGLRRVSQDAPAGPAPTSANGVALVDTAGYTPAQERRQGSENYLESLEMTETEKQNFVEDHSKLVTPESLAEMLGGVKITLPSK